VAPGSSTSSAYNISQHNFHPIGFSIVAAAKKAAAPVAKGKPVKQDAPKETAKKWTKEDEAARKIQCLVRNFLSKRALEKKKKEKEEYDELMDRLEKEVIAAV
jgi:hypothetical protein